MGAPSNSPTRETRGRHAVRTGESVMTPSESTYRADNTTDKDDDNTSIASTVSQNMEEDDLSNTDYLQRQSTMSKSYTPSEERAVIKRLDKCLIGFLAFLYLLSFLDRSNIGNARIAGLENALNITPRQFDWCLIAFYITYITFEWMILLYKLVPPHIYISLCVFSWGLVASLQSSVTSFTQFVTLRAFLGITEAAFGPGVPFYMTFFYRREELAYRVGLQISAAPLATALASSIAWVIVKLNSYTGLEDWRALFLFEGAPSILVAVFAWYWIPDSPSTARFLTPRQRKVATRRIQEVNTDTPISKFKKFQSTATTSPTTTKSKSKLNLSTHLPTSDLITTLLDPKSYLTSLMFLSVNVSFSSLPVFLPTIIHSMSFPALTSHILSAPPYLISFIFVLLIGHYSDNIPNSRGLFLCGVSALSSLAYLTIAIAGYLSRKNLIGDTTSIVIRYIAIYPAAMGLFSSVMLIITWTLNNQRTTTGKGMGMVILNVVGQCGPLVGVQLFPERQGPEFVTGMVVCAAFMAGVAVLSCALRVYLRWLNTEREKGEGKGMYEMVGVGDGDFGDVGNGEGDGGRFGGGGGGGDGDGGADRGKEDDEEQEGLIDGYRRKRNVVGNQLFRYML